MTDEVSWAKPFASGHTRAQWAIYLLAAGIVMALLAAGSSYMQIGLLSRVVAGEHITRAEAIANARRLLVIVLSRFFVFLVTVVLFLMWLHRVYRNLPALGVRHPEYSPSWAVGCFFVPYINLVRPFQIVGEIWRSSEPDSGEEDVTPFHFAQAQSRSAPALVKAWWLLYITTGVVGYLSWLLTLSGGNSAADLVALNWMIVGGHFFNMLAAILAILVIKNIDRLQEEKSQRLAAAATSAGLDVSMN